MPQPELLQFLYPGLLWPALFAETTSKISEAFAKQFIETLAGPEIQRMRPEPQWTTRNQIALELRTVRLRDFSLSDEGRPALICAPFSLHAATIVDFAPGHSLVAMLRQEGLRRLFVTDWRSADLKMRDFGIDAYLADLNVLVDHLGGAADLIGLCQGGWMALLYAARFPKKTRKLVVAGAPIDIGAGATVLSALARATPLAFFEYVVALGGGLVHGQRALKVAQPIAMTRDEIRTVLQTALSPTAPAFTPIEQHFRDWNECVVDLPGAYFLEIVEKIFKRNEIATGAFVALGQSIKLANVKAPTYLLAAREDKLVAPQQLLSASKLIGAAQDQIVLGTAPGGHLSLYMGERTLAQFWPKIAHWLIGRGHSASHRSMEGRVQEAISQ